MLSSQRLTVMPLAPRSRETPRNMKNALIKVWRVHPVACPQGAGWR